VTVFTNFRLVQEDSEALGTLTVRDGRIADIQPGATTTTKGDYDGGGDAYLLPGLVELHSDHLERCLSPRPGAPWPPAAAAIWYDRDLIAAGITTVCAAIALRDLPRRPLDRKERLDIIETLTGDGLRADHYLHLRCELTTPSVDDTFESLASHPLLRVVSVMDHSPGQRQFVAYERFRAYYQYRYGMSDTELETFVRTMTEQEAVAAADRRRQRIAGIAKTYGLCLASHDDATAAHVDEGKRDGITISEFPTTAEAATGAVSAGQLVLMGAPNLVLARSHSANLSARDAAASGALNILSSDYVPQSLLYGAFLLADIPGWSLPAAIRTVTQVPATAIGLDHDRGSLTVGKRADLLTVRRVKNAPPILDSVFVSGQRVG
jgi:alpha-D-ribose 1-methylphosphonate 5-triphosphate diphosphatase